MADPRTPSPPAAATNDASAVSWPVCSSRGPRIGGDGVPYCRKPAGHRGWHAPDPDDGWDATVVWTDLLGEARTWRDRHGVAPLERTR